MKFAMQVLYEQLLSKVELCKNQFSYSDCLLRGVNELVQILLVLLTDRGYIVAEDFYKMLNSYNFLENWCSKCHTLL